MSLHGVQEHIRAEKEDSRIPRIAGGNELRSAGMHRVSPETDRHSRPKIPSGSSDPARCSHIPSDGLSGLIPNVTIQPASAAPIPFETVAAKAAASGM